MQKRSKAEIAQAVRWKLPSLNRLGYREMWRELESIQDTLYEMHYFIEEGDETFMNAMDGEEDEEREFRMMFSELEGEAEDIREMFSSFDNGVFPLLMTVSEQSELYEDEPEYTTCRLYDDCTVALIGRGFNFGMNGFDVYEMDAFGLDDGSAEYAAKQAQKRLLRLTKEKLVDTVGQAVSIMLRFQEFFVHYQILTQTFEQIRGANLSTLQVMRDIDTTYEVMAADMADSKLFGYGYRIISDKGKAAERQFDRLLENLPDRLWVE